MFLRLTGVSINLNHVSCINTFETCWTFWLTNLKDPITLSIEQQVELEATYKFDDESGVFLFKTPAMKAGKTDWVR